MKTFEHWKSEELELQIGIKRIKRHPALMQWLAATYEATENESYSVERLRIHLEDNAEYWNEDELKFFFISPLLNIVDFVTEHYKPFTQRNFGGKVKDIHGQEIELKGRVEFIVATGKQDPREPYFFVHEYKQEAPPFIPPNWGDKGGNDPLGQVLSAMVAAQQNNEGMGVETIYGCYVIGRFWFLVILIGKEYGVSSAFDATKQADISQVFACIQAAKTEINRYFSI